MSTAIVWLRQDLRLHDNPALYHAATQHAKVIAVYLHAPQEMSPWQPGAASNVWRHHSLLDLQRSITALGGQLVIRQGSSLENLLQLCQELNATAIYWNHDYRPAAQRRDAKVCAALDQQGIAHQQFHVTLMHPPGSILNKEQQPYRVFTAFWRACQKIGFDSTPLPAPEKLHNPDIDSATVASLALIPQKDWATSLMQHWSAGETAALQKLDTFIDDRLRNYRESRDHPSIEGTSELSPYLAFGEISPRQILAALNQARHDFPEESIEYFIRELAWRDFAAHTLHHFPESSAQPIDKRFVQFPWQNNPALLRAWQQGNTGIPIVDAGMRQLWHCGWMHNRVRMIVASLLCKNGLIHWHEGAQWFWDTLVDADLANNSFNWQWVAGCGLDAAPYFRIFNPVTQSEKFDADGSYLRRWVPELSNLPSRWIHAPWRAPETILSQAQITLGIDYPVPVIELDLSRNAALQTFKTHLRK